MTSPEFLRLGSSDCGALRLGGLPPSVASNPSRLEANGRAAEQHRTPSREVRRWVPFPVPLRKAVFTWTYSRINSASSLCPKLASDRFGIRWFCGYTPAILITLAVTNRRKTETKWRLAITRNQLDFARTMGETAGQSLLSVPPILGDFVRRFLVRREKTAITLLILTVIMLDVVAVLILVKY
jgi:hypothetical protein